MANLKHWLLDEAGGEPIEAVVIGEMIGGGDYKSKDVPTWAAQPRGDVVTWEQAAPLIDYEFDNGFGMSACNRVYAWTQMKVIAIGEYDGSTYCSSVPRHPVACHPTTF